MVSLPFSAIKLAAFLSASDFSSISIEISSFYLAISMEKNTGAHQNPTQPLTGLQDRDETSRILLRLMRATHIHEIPLVLA